MNKNFVAELPEKFRQNALDLCGAPGEQWLNNLPSKIKEIEHNWSLDAGKHFRNLSYNYVAPCVRADGGEAVLKIALPLPSNNPQILSEARFLHTANGVGAVILLNLDESRRAILLEKLTPGENLKEACRQDERRAVEIFIRIARRLLKEPPPNFSFQKLDDWFDNFLRKAVGTKFPFEAQNKAHKFYEQLNSASNRKFLIHGDLHHENILSAGREAFLAIDPKGLVGEVGYEIAVFLNNHYRWLAAQPDVREKLNGAVEHLSEAFAIEPLNLRKWAYLQTVLSAWWTFEENGKNWEKDLSLAEFWEV